LRAPEQRDRAVVGGAEHAGIPDLGRAPAVHQARLARQLAGGEGAEEVRLQLDGGEAGRVIGKAAPAPVAAGGIGEPDDDGRVEVTVRREELVGDLSTTSKPISPGNRPGLRALSASTSNCGGVISRFSREFGCNPPTA
jgi:hypothetical protein